MREIGQINEAIILKLEERIEALESVLKEGFQEIVNFIRTEFGLENKTPNKLVNCICKLSAKDEREAGISRIKPKARERPCYNDEWCPSDCQGDAEEPCTTYEEQASGGVKKPIDSLNLSFKCPYCNHQISIKKEDLDGI